MERRRFARHARYFPVRFGVEENAWEARTRDVSAGGMFVATGEVLPPGTRLWLDLFIEPERALHLEGVVVRKLDALPARRREGGFAVRLLSPAEALRPYIPTMRDTETQLPSVGFDSREALERIAERGLADGSYFVWSRGEHSVGERVKLALGLTYAATVLELRGTVTQVVEDAGRMGLALALDDVDEVRAELARVLEVDA